MSKPTNLEFQKIFDHVAQKYDQISNPYTVNKRKEFFAKWAKGQCLEVGAGTGEISLALKQKGFDVVATDISPKMVAEIKKKGVKAIVSDAEKLPFEKNSFNTVIAGEMLYYLDKPEKFITEAYRLLKPKGHLLISSANEEMKIIDRLRTFLRKVGIAKTYFDDPINKFNTTKQIDKLLREGKFKNIRIRKVILGMFIVASARK